MKKKYLSVAMAFILSFTTLAQPMVAFGEELNGDKTKSEIKVEQPQVVQEEPVKIPENPTTEGNKTGVTNEKTPSTDSKEPVKNKGQPNESVKSNEETVKEEPKKEEPITAPKFEEVKPTQAQAKAGDTTETKISQEYTKYNEDGTPKKEFMAGEDFVYNVNLSVSGNVSTLTDHVVRVELDDEFIENFTISKPQSASSIEYKVENGKKVAYIKFPQLAGGTDLTFPVKVKLKKGETPENYELKMNSTLIDNKGTELKQANELDYKTTYEKPKVTKRINGDEQDGKLIWSGMDDGTGHVKEGTEMPVKFTFSSSISEGHRVHRNYDELIITDTLPKGAVFDPALNPGWVLSADGKTVTYDLKANNKDMDNYQLSRKLDEVALFLKFPKAPLLEDLVNNVDINHIQKDKKPYEPDVIVGDDIKFQLEGKATGYTFGKRTVPNTQIKDTISNKSREDYAYDLNLANTVSVPLHNVVIDDFKREDGTYSLDERLIFAKLVTDRGIQGEKVTAYVQENGKIVEKVIKGEANGNNVTYNFPKPTMGYKVEFPTLNAYDNWHGLAYVTVRDPEKTHFDPNNPEKNLFENEASFKGDIIDEATKDVLSSLTGKSSDKIPFIEFKEAFTISKYVDNREVQFKGNTLSMTIYTGLHDTTLDADTVLKNVKLVDLLPNGLTPIEKDAQEKGYKIVQNYKNTGRTALVWDLGDIRGGDYKPYTTKDFPILRFNTTVNDLSATGNNRNDAYLLADNADDVALKDDGRYTADDKHDLDGDGKTDDKVIYGGDDYNYAPNKEITLRKSIQNQEMAKNDVWSYEGVSSLYGEDVNYKLSLKNYLDVEVPKVTIYDVFPYKGDKSIIPNDNGEYTSRGSVFGNSLTGEIKAPQGFTVYYTTDKVLDNASESLTKLNWAKSVSDYSKVTAIKIVMDSDRVLGSKETVDFNYTMKAPNGGLERKDKAYNSAAVSVNGGDAFVEGNKVFNEMDLPARPEVSKDVEGKEHLDIEKNKEFKYHVKSKVPDSTKGWKSLTLKDTLDNRLHVVDAKVLINGKVQEDLKPTIKGQEVSFTFDEEQLRHLEEKEVTLEITSKIDSSAPIEIINNKGVIQLNEEPSIESNNVTVKPIDRKSKLRIVKVEGEGKNSFEQVVDVPVTAFTDNSIVSNLVKPKELNIPSLSNPLGLGVVKGETVYLGGAKFQLLDSNKNLVKEVTTDENGVVEIEELPLGNYYLQEVEAPKGHIIDSTLYPLTLTETDQDKVMFQYTFNNPKDPETPVITKDVEGKE
ncbi:isopeptide-forming domain-containing fimbrial protein, partial [Bacillus cereus]|uniref:isopeptide-forming domain-containing fimbrial protein n=1 Tax=Bacillus cereus TaxID=1396 RepID=UPI003D1690B4